MRDETGVPLSTLTTLRVGGPARRLVTVETEAELLDAVRELDAAGEPLLLLGGGSNVVAPDGGVDATVVRVATRGVEVCEDGCSGASVTVAAGESWDALVERAAMEGWAGLEALSGIPGLTGATPVQNVGAYGQEVSATLARLRTYDRDERAIRTFAAAECGFGYRRSLFKGELRGGSPRWVVLDVTFQLRVGDLGDPVAYAELARVLGVQPGGRAPLERVREAVLQLRRGKGMVLDEVDRDTWSAGSFFVNPVLDSGVAAALPDGAPRWPQPGGRTKTSAAWLIEHAGFTRGYGSGEARLSTRHTLALTNRGGATSADVLRLAREVRDGVRARFGVELDPEPLLLGTTL